MKVSIVALKVTGIYCSVVKFQIDVDCRLKKSQMPKVLITSVVFWV